MSLKDIWTNKTDGVDDVLAEDINSIAEAVITLEANGDSGESEVYLITGTIDLSTNTITTTATYAEIKAAVEANKIVVLNLTQNTSTIYVFSLYNIEGAFAYFTATDNLSVRSVLCTNTNEWSYSVCEHESTTNKKTIIDGNETNDRQYPSVPAVINYVSTAIGKALEGNY